MLNRLFYSGCFFVLMVVFGCHQHDNDTLKICFTGDLLLDRGVRQKIDQVGIDALFAKVTDLFHHSDAVVTNLECPVTEMVAPINKHFIFRGEPKWLPSLKKAGITHLAMANNHSNDQGRDAIVDTYHQIISHQLIPLGFGMNQEEACKPVIIEKNNRKAAIFNSVFLTLENFPFFTDKPGVCQASTRDLARIIRVYKSAHPATYVVVVLHWGTEYQTMAEPAQRSEARQLIDAGADVIIGHHPHVIQTIEYIKGKPVIYSLGNFVFDPKRAEASKGLIVKLIFSKNEISVVGEEISIEGCIPRITREYVICNKDEKRKQMLPE